MSRTKLKQKKLTSCPKPYQDCLAVWKALRQLGFESDDIFFGFGPVNGSPDVMHMQLNTQGKEFVVAVAIIPGATYESTTKVWREIATLSTKVDPEELEALFRSHLLGSSTEYFQMFAAEIVRKGILLPAFPDMMPHAGQA